MIGIAEGGDFFQSTIHYNGTLLGWWFGFGFLWGLFLSELIQTLDKGWARLMWSRFIYAFSNFFYGIINDLLDTVLL